MIKHFIRLEWKAFWRSAAFRTNLALRIILFLVAVYFAVVFIMLGVGLYFLLTELKMDPIASVNRYMIYYIACDLFIRYFMQKMPVINIKPMLILPIPRDTIVHFALAKSIISFFNIIHAFFLVPFAITLIYHDFPASQVVPWLIAVFALLYCGNFVNVLINNKDRYFYPAVAIVAVLALAQYFGLYNITNYTAPIFGALYDIPIYAIIPVLFVVVLYWFSFRVLRNLLHLDTGLAKKTDIAQT